MENIIKNDKELIAYCGLYCGACGKYINGKCPGCRENEKAKWCKIRTCNMQRGQHTCAECKDNIKECKEFNNFFSKLFGFIFRSDRMRCINLINEIGEDAYAKEMSEKKIMTLKK